MGDVARVVPSRHRAMAQKGAPAGQMTWAMHITLAPTWFDPAETGALQTPYLCLRALHDALVKPMPDGHLSPCLATRWHESEDGLTYDFELRHGVKFHNGDPFTAEDVKFSFERYKGAGAAELKKQVKAIEMVHPHHIRFVLHAPWPDFDLLRHPGDGRRLDCPQAIRRRSATTPLKISPWAWDRIASCVTRPASNWCWTPTPTIGGRPPGQAAGAQSVPEPATRLAMLKQQEADVTYAIYSTLGEEVQRDTALKLEPTLAGIQWGSFVDMYAPKSPWHDKRVRLAANHAINRQAINEAETLGYSKLVGGLSPRRMTLPYGWSRMRTIPRRRKPCSKKRGMRRVSMPGSFRVMPSMRASLRRW